MRLSAPVAAAVYRAFLDRTVPWTAAGKTGDKYRWRFVSLEGSGGGSSPDLTQALADARDMVKRDTNLCAIELLGSDEFKASYSSNPQCLLLAASGQEPVSSLWTTLRNAGQQRYAWLAIASAVILGAGGAAVGAARGQRRRAATGAALGAAVGSTLALFVPQPSSPTAAAFLTNSIAGFTAAGGTALTVRKDRLGPMAGASAAAPIGLFVGLFPSGIWSV